MSSDITCGAAEPLVTGQIVIAAATPSLSGATIHVYLEHTSYADAAASTVAETTIANVGHRAGSETTLAFALDSAPRMPPIDPHNDYTVRVWLDCDGDGNDGPGDLYSHQSYPVLTRSFGRTVTITLGPR